MRAFCVTWERRAVGNGCFFSVLVGFERRASNGVKRAFFVGKVKKNTGSGSQVRYFAYWGLGDALGTRQEKQKNYAI